jgi:diketogulonate reductase-like aldo/keto reductase
MIKIVLPNGRTTSRLAFGCGGIGGSVSYKDSRKLLMAAWDSGFRHFDVAPSYGLGVAEIYLARFLEEAGRNEVTITTKAGIARPTTVRRVAAQSVQRVLRQSPALRRTLKSMTPPSTPQTQFSIRFLQTSLEDSLRLLRVDSIDVFLMHEMTHDNFHDDVLAFLHHAKCAGKIGCFGIGSRRDRLESLLPLSCNCVDALQTSWALDSCFPHADGILQNFHGVLRTLEQFTTLLESNRDLKDCLSSVLAIDLGHPQGRVDALLSLALADGDRGLIIVQSRRVTRITQMEVDRRISPSVISSAALRRLLEAVRSRAN